MIRPLPFLLACAALGVAQDSPGDAPAKEAGPTNPFTAALPVGKWTVQFTNGVTEECDIFKFDGEGHAAVEEPQRKSRGKVAVECGSVAITFNDDRVERWTSVGKRFVVEHWFPASGFPTATPVLGIATLARTGDAKADKNDARLSDDDRQRLEETGPAIVKEFVATLRERFSDKNAGDLRKFIDPRYLKVYNLQDGHFPILTVVTRSIYDNQISDDPRTLVIIAQTEDAAKEVFVFRTTVYEGKVYLQPLSPPNPTTRSFMPWTLRIKL